MESEYEEIQSHTIDPNQVIERDDIRGCDPTVFAEIPDPPDEPQRGASETASSFRSVAAGLSASPNEPKEHGVFSMEDFMKAFQDLQGQQEETKTDNLIKLKDESKRVLPKISIQLKSTTPQVTEKHDENQQQQQQKATTNPIQLLAIPSDIALLVDDHVTNEAVASQQQEKLKKELQQEDIIPEMHRR